jgi:hypothetical protein
MSGHFGRLSSTRNPDHSPFLRKISSRNFNSVTNVYKELKLNWKDSY